MNYRWPKAESLQEFLQRIPGILVPALVQLLLLMGGMYMLIQDDLRSIALR